MRNIPVWGKISLGLAAASLITLAVAGQARNLGFIVEDIRLDLDSADGAEHGEGAGLSLVRAA